MNQHAFVPPSSSASVPLGSRWGGDVRNISLSPGVYNAVLKPYFASHLADIWGVLNNMNYVLRNKLLTPLEFLQEHFNPDPKTVQIIISCTFSPVQADMGTDCNKTHCVEVGAWGRSVGRLL